MKILAINGSPRGKHGNTDRILQPFLRGAAAAGADWETVYAKDLNVKECTGCFTCWQKTPGVCVFKDDMAELLLKMRCSDMIVWATPLYLFGMNVRLRRIIERTLPLYMPYMVKRGDRFTHPPRFDDLPSKAVLISNCGFPERSNFDALVDTFEKIHGTSLSAAILCPGGELLGVEALQEQCSWYLKAAYDAGREMIETGQISVKTATLLEAPLVPVEAFVGMANANWGVAGETPPTLEDALYGCQTPAANGKDKGEWHPLPSPRDGGTLQEMISGMAVSFQPEAAGDLRAVLQFEVTGQEPGQYFLQIDSGRCQAFEGKHPAAKITIHTPSEVWMAICRGEISGAEALMQGKYYVDGDIKLLSDLDRLFKTERRIAESPAAQPVSRTGKGFANITEVLKGMAEVFNRRPTTGLDAVYQFQITGGTGAGLYHLQIADGRCTFHEGPASDPSVTIITPEDVWLGIARGEIDGTAALMEGRYRFEGNMDLLIKMKTLFSGDTGGKAIKPLAPGGPLRIPGMQWLTAAFLPWTYFWIFSGSHNLSSLAVPLAASLAVLIYRLKFMDISSMDIGGPLFFGLMVLLYFTAPDVLFKYGLVLSSLALALIWTSSLITDTPLTASYSKYRFPEGFAKNTLFIKINAIITAFWALIYIIQAVIIVVAPVNLVALYRVFWMIGSYILLIPAFIFTARFPDWYISHQASRKNEVASAL